MQHLVAINKSNGYNGVEVGDKTLAVAEKQSSGGGGGRTTQAKPKAR